MFGRSSCEFLKTAKGLTISSFLNIKQTHEYTVIYIRIRISIKIKISRPEIQETLILNGTVIK